uniref:Uncharacterized protein AlNc14C120G6639 n=1 Tax=Albugo laibachii Nc14 TaxID=890382 RepID=F0WJB2_9STRA|nr:conserved hypothetical protein [Albugo laibachii Nc14]|eukprot:CCA21359.1 conserved hypothetical protein [Albugo laibachii Nc14]
MALFGASDRFPTESARSPGPMYAVNESKRWRTAAVMKTDFHAIDETKRWGKREGWIAERDLAPGKYDQNADAILKHAPAITFSKSLRFASQKGGLLSRCFGQVMLLLIVNMTDKEHQRELLTVESPGPMYNPGSTLRNGMKPKCQISFAAPTSPRASTCLPAVNKAAIRSSRDSWLSIINRKDILLLPPSPRKQAINLSPLHVETRDAEKTKTTSSLSTKSSKIKSIGSLFGHQDRFGAVRSKFKKKEDTARPRRTQLISVQHARENLGEYSPGPIYNPHRPVCSGGRLAPALKASFREAYLRNVHSIKNPNSNLSSRSTWLSGNIQKQQNGIETVVVGTGDIVPGPGSYIDPPSSFSKPSHNTRARTLVNKSTLPEKCDTLHGVASLRFLDLSHYPFSRHCSLQSDACCTKVSSTLEKGSCQNVTLFKLMLVNYTKIKTGDTFASP